MSMENVEISPLVGGATVATVADMDDTAWYIVQVISGREKSFIKALDAKFEEDSSLKLDIVEVFIPTERVVGRKNGKEQLTERKFYPNYIFVRMKMSSHNWHLINRMSMVKGFVGERNKRVVKKTSIEATNQQAWLAPNKISVDEITKMRERMDEGAGRPKPKIEFTIGENVRIKTGAFTDFSGDVTDVNYEQSRITVRVNVFSKQTPVEIDFEQVEKV